MINSTLSGNSATVYGGGIFNIGTLTMQNSALSANSASSEGGGIENYINSTLTMLNSTLSANSAIYGGGINNETNKLHLYNTLVAYSPSGGDCRGRVDTNDHNLIEDTGGDACD